MPLWDPHRASTPLNSIHILKTQKDTTQDSHVQAASENVRDKVSQKLCKFYLTYSLTSSVLGLGHSLVEHERLPLITL